MVLDVESNGVAAHDVRVRPKHDGVPTMINGARTPLTVDLGGYRVAISAGANGMTAEVAAAKKAAIVMTR